MKVSVFVIVQEACLYPLFKLALCFAIFGKVHGSNLFCFINLSLVGFDLLLQFVNKILHPFMVLLIFFRLEGEFLNTSLSLPQVLLSISMSTGFIVKLCF